MGRPDERGAGLEPPRAIVWLTPELVPQLAGARRLALRLDDEMLATTRLALVPFVGVDPMPVKSTIPPPG